MTDKGILPSPVVLDLDRVRSRIEKNLSSRNSDPSCCGRQGDLAASSTIQRNGSVLVAIWPIVNDFQIVQGLSGAGDGELDLVTFSVKATNVSSTWGEISMSSHIASLQCMHYSPVKPATSVATVTPVKAASSA